MNNENVAKYESEELNYTTMDVYKMKNEKSKYKK